ncbi:MAG: radical SAM protein [Candidatus Omnitrophica bacterium]|nr:radical SAM protein [Candidatus Omnitrophota bacterium]
MLPKNNEAVDLLIIIPPSRSKNTHWPPYGAMYVAGALKKEGFVPKILNVDAERIGNKEVIERVKEINPRYIGFSAMVATSYKYIKNLSIELKDNFPDKIQILGGGLSNAAEVVLKNTAVDIVVFGEGEVTACELINCLKAKCDDPGNVSGIFYKKNSSYINTGNRPLIRDLDALPYPAFDLIDMSHYLPDGIDQLDQFIRTSEDRKISDKKRKTKMMNILTTRGCFGSCSFCARPDPGFRMHSVKYIFDLIEHCIREFNVGFFYFGDECFVPNKKRNWEFIEEYRKRNLDIIFRILGLRVDTVDKDILKAYKEIGCCIINYGFESGSQKMLNIIDKRVTVQQNIDAALWTEEAGICFPVQLILGMPGETNETIKETISFLKSINYLSKQCKCTYALPMPGSALYDYAKLTQAIENEDEYLSHIGEIDGTQGFHINLTEEEDSVVAGWRAQINRGLYDFYFEKKYKINNRFIRAVIHLFESFALHVREKNLWSVVISRRLKLFLYSILNMRCKKRATQQINCRFRRKKNINIEDFLEGNDILLLNRDITLRKINEKIATGGRSYEKGG